MMPVEKICKEFAGIMAMAEKYTKLYTGRWLLAMKKEWYTIE